MNKVEPKKYIQFLVSPQLDFIGRNKPETKQLGGIDLHVGEDSIQRLRGEGQGKFDPFVEISEHILGRSENSDGKISVVLDEDWHNTNDPEFVIFKQHCIKGSKGASLPKELEKYRWNDYTYTIRANSINVASHRHYQQALKSIMGAERPERFTRTDEVRVGVYGVWTHIKVEYLLLSLSTMPPAIFPRQNLGVCAPLCASPEIADHDYAIEKFRKLGYTVFDDILAYLKWMGLSPDKTLQRSIESFQKHVFLS